MENVFLILVLTIATKNWSSSYWLCALNNYLAKHNFTIFNFSFYW